MNHFGHVLLIRTDHLGDMFLTLPAATALKQAHPACRVSVLASTANAVAAQHHPHVDHVEIDAYEAKGSGFKGLMQLRRQIRDLACDAAVVVHPTPRLALAVFLAAVPLRIGTAYRAYSFLFNRRIKQHRRQPPWKHESEYNVDLLAPLGVGPESAASVTWTVTDEELATVDAWRRERGVTAPLVILHPGNAGSAMNWAPRQYGELGKLLAAAGAHLAITGGKAEVALTAEVTAVIGPAAMDLGNQLTLPQLAALLRRANLYVGSATGPTHLAAAVGTPVIALYSPLWSSAPQRWRPLGAEVEIVQPKLDLSCRQCLGERCPYFNCMERHLSVGEVFTLARRRLAAPAPS